MVICLGKETFDSVLDAYEAPRPYTGKFISALDAGKTFAHINGIRFFGMGHCGALGCMNRIGNKKGVKASVGFEKQAEDWKRIREYWESIGK